MENMNLILEKIRSEGFLEEIISEKLEKQLDLELKKSSPDYDLVDELTKTILEARGKAVKEIDVKPEIQAIRQRKIKRIRFPKWVVSLSAACFILFCTNCISVFAWNVNIVSAVIEFTKGGFTVEFIKPETEIIELPTSENDPYGLIAKLAEYDIEFETPYYIPEGFVLTEVDTNVNKNFANDVCFIFRNGKQNFSIEYTKFWNNVVPIGIPSDHYNISETTVNDSPAIVSKEDGQYTITYQKEKTNFFFFSVDVPYSECEKIIASIK